MKEIWEQLCKELKNYCLQNGFTDVILGLSGGLDSAVTAVLAADALGPEHVHALMLQTRYTSKLSLLIAKKIAKQNAIDYKVLKIQKLIDGQEKFLTEAFGTQPNKLVMENLQARERGKILMAYANQYNYLVLSCGNKSEAAMGYCTLYGDTCGGLMPIGDLYKSQIFELAKWLFPKAASIRNGLLGRGVRSDRNPGNRNHYHRGCRQRNSHGEHLPD